VGLNTDVQVAERPVTQQGMMGMKMKAQGPGRQVLDKSFYLGELRNKRQALQTVVSEMDEEINNHETNSTTYMAVERKYEALNKDLKALQGTLTDYNIILDKSSTDTDAGEIEAQFRALKERNDIEKKKMDGIFTDRQQMDARVKDVDRQIQTFQRSMENKLNELAPDKRQQYFDLQNENKGLLADVARMEADIESESRDLIKLENELQQNQLKQRALALNEQIRQLNEKKYELEVEESRANLSPEEQRQELLNKIKRDNADVAAAEDQVRELSDSIRKLEARAGGAGPMDMGGGGGGGGGDAESADKYEQLVRQEAELTDFIANFDSNKAKATNETRAAQAEALELLEKLTRTVEMSAALPSKNRYRDMQDELEYKKVQMDNAANTSDRLQQEKNLRKQELDKINTLEEKIRVELESLNEKIKTMNADMDKFSNVGDLEGTAKEQRRRLEAEKIRLHRRKDVLKDGVVAQNVKYEAKKAQLQENEFFSATEALETKMRSLEQVIFQAEDYIRARERANNYKPMVDKISGIVDEINSEVQKAARLG